MKKHKQVQMSNLKILELINRIKKERNLSVIFITHDLGVVANMADRIAVMYAGKIVEYGTFGDLIKQKGEFYKQYKIQSEALKTIGIGVGTGDMPEEDENEHKTAGYYSFLPRF